MRGVSSLDERVAAFWAGVQRYRRLAQLARRVQPSPVAQESPEGRGKPSPEEVRDRILRRQRIADEDVLALMLDRERRKVKTLKFLAEDPDFQYLDEDERDRIVVEMMERLQEEGWRGKDRERI